MWIYNPKLNFNFVSFEQNLDEINKLNPKKKISEPVPIIKGNKDKLNPKKKSQITGIPVPIIKGNKDVIALFVYHNFNNSLSSSFFPTGLKYADVRLVFKKGDKNDKENYRPISIQPNISKVYERLMYDQLYPYLNFRKGCYAEQCITSMIEKLGKVLNVGNHAGAPLTNLSKALDYVDQELLLAKRNAYGFFLFFFYGFDSRALYFLFSYLDNRKNNESKLFLCWFWRNSF